MQEETQDIIPEKKPYFSVDPWKLDEELTKWCNQYHENKAKGLERPQMNEYLGRSIMQIANGISARYNFVGYSFRDEMVSDAIVHVITYAYNYDNKAATRSGRPPAYSYIYLMCLNCFKNRITFEEEEQVLKYIAIEQMGGVDAFEGEDPAEYYSEEDKSASGSIIADYMNKIYEYEEKVKARKKAKEDKKVKEIKEMTLKNDTLMFFMDDDDEEDTFIVPQDDVKIDEVEDLEECELL